jgi:hypothetical protein
VEGLTLQFDDDYLGFQKECAEHIRNVIDKYKLVRDVPPGEKVTEVEQAVQERVRSGMRQIDVGAAAIVRGVFVNEPYIAEQLFRTPLVSERCTNSRTASLLRFPRIRGLSDPGWWIQGVSKNHAVNTAKVSTLLNAHVSQRTNKGTRSAPS